MILYKPSRTLERKCSDEAARIVVYGVSYCGLRYPGIDTEILHVILARAPGVEGLGPYGGIKQKGGDKA